jgi:hypothetical protein
MSGNFSLIALKEALRFGQIKLGQISLDKRSRPKKWLSVLMFIATQSYSESILKLLAPPGVFDLAAEVVLRSLIENVINFNYIFSSRSDRNAWIFAIYSIRDRIDFAEKYKSFWIRYPGWKMNFGPIKKPSDWDAFIDLKEKEIQKIKKRYKHLSLDSNHDHLRERAAVADNYLNSLGKLNSRNSLEKYYVFYYKHFSQISHLTSPGLERFFLKEADGTESLRIHGSSEDTDRVIPIVYAIYISMLRSILKQFGIYNKEEFKKYLDTFRSIK